jgi:RNA polymerase sigma-70 factor (ECF subfamily)
LPFGPVKDERLLSKASQDESPAITFSRTDEALMAMLGERRQEAIGCLFRRYASTVYAVGKRILRDAGEAEDLVQEVFLYLLRKSNIYDPSKSSARSWIVQVAYTQALLRRRELKSHGLYSPGIPNKQIESHQDGSHDGADYDHSVEGLFGRDGWRKIVEELTNDQRETLRLHFFEGLTFAEIAEKFGQSHRNIRNHHYRGLEKLRKHIARSKLNVR